MPENSLAASIWHTCNFHDRPVSMSGGRPIPTQAIRGMCEVFNATVYDFRKVLSIERIVFPAIQGRESADPENEEEDPEGK